MLMFECPHCKQSTLSLKQKLLAGKWSDVICPHCARRSCVYPSLLVVVYFFYTWDLMLFGYLTVHEKSVLYFSVMIGAWLMLELFSLSLPLARMKSKPISPDQDSSNPPTQ